MLRESEPPGKLEGTWGRLLPSQYPCLRALLRRAPAMGFLAFAQLLLFCGLGFSHSGVSKAAS